MKYEVQVGQEFPCYVIEDPPQSPPVIVNVTQNTAAPPASEDAKKPRLSVIGFVLVAVLLGIVPATVYGVATGDFSALKTIALSTRDLMEFGSKLLK